MQHLANRNRFTPTYHIQEVCFMALDAVLIYEEHFTNVPLEIPLVDNFVQDSLILQVIEVSNELNRKYIGRVEQRSIIDSLTVVVNRWSVYSGEKRVFSLPPVRVNGQDLEEESMVFIPSYRGFNLTVKVWEVV
jgi:hypothetical protein